jgi:hypothetical protein
MVLHKYSHVKTTMNLPTDAHFIRCVPLQIYCLKVICTKLHSFPYLQEEENDNNRENKSGLDEECFVFNSARFFLDHKKVGLIWSYVTYVRK